MMKPIGLDDVEELLSELVKIPSPNPPGYTDEVAAFIAGFLEDAGLEVEVVSKSKRRENVVATLQGEEEGLLIFNSHIDVVPIGDPKRWSLNPWGGEVVEKRLYGRGSSDCKAGAAAMMLAAKSIAESGVRPKHSVALHLVCDEETGGPNGTRFLVERGYAEGGVAVISGEPCYHSGEGIHLDVAAKGLIWLEITTHGRAAHAKVPHLGVNAIEKMATIILALRDMRLPEISHRYLGEPTLNIGLIEGGVKVNIVPDRCIIKVDRRILPQENPERVIKDVEEILEELKAKVEGLMAECRVLKVWPPSETEEGETVVQFIKKTLERLSGSPPKVSGKLGATDMWLYNRRGIPTIHVGPGVALNSHITDEYAELEPILLAVELYQELMTSF